MRIGGEGPKLEWVLRDERFGRPAHSFAVSDPLQLKEPIPKSQDPNNE